MAANARENEEKMRSIKEVSLLVNIAVITGKNINYFTLHASVITCSDLHFISGS